MKKTKTTKLEVGDVINLWDLGEWKIVGIDERYVHLVKIDDENWIWDISNRKTHPQYQMLIKAKEGKSKEQTKQEIMWERAVGKKEKDL